MAFVRTLGERVLFVVECVTLERFELQAQRGHHARVQHREHVREFIAERARFVRHHVLHLLTILERDTSPRKVSIQKGASVTIGHFSNSLQAASESPIAFTISHVSAWTVARLNPNEFHVGIKLLNKRN
jgi:hypothetical protein